MENNLKEQHERAMEEKNWKDSIGKQQWRKAIEEKERQQWERKIEDSIAKKQWRKAIEEKHRRQQWKSNGICEQTIGEHNGSE